MRDLEFLTRKVLAPVLSLLLTLPALLGLLQARINLQWWGQLEPDRIERRAIGSVPSLLLTLPTLLGLLKLIKWPKRDF